MIYILSSPYILWVFYLAVMNLKRSRDAGTIPKTALVLGYPLLIVGFTIDILVNISIGSLLFLEWPNYKRLSLSARMSYLVNNDHGWRAKLAKFIGENLLDPFDPSGKHIK